MYECKFCCYETDRKANFDRHNVSTKHKTVVSKKLAKSSTQKRDASREQLSKYTCKKCGKGYNHSSSLARHNKNCKQESVVISQVNALQEQIDQMKRQFEERESKLVRELKKLKNTNGVPQVTNYNFIQQHFGNAPVLEPLDYHAFKPENENFTIFDELIYSYNNNKLSKYIGDQIIKEYKKDDPKDQALWNGDKARMTYFIRTLINDVPSWKEDGNAEDVKRIVVKPLLNWISGMIKKEVPRIKKLGEQGKIDIFKELPKMQSLIYIQSECIHEDLPARIIKYITPTFHLDQGALLLK